MSEPEVVFPEQEHPSDVEIWLEDSEAVRMRVSWSLILDWTPQEARAVGLALQELADRAHT